MAAATAPSEVCRCCLAPGAPGKDLSCQYDWMGEKEVYADMLLESFDITLSRAAAAGWVICEVCVSRLRDSTNFKKQVLHAERFLLQRLGAALEPTAKSGGVDMKVERLKAESAESDDDDAREHQFETHFCDDEDEMKDVSVKFEPGASTSNTEMSNDEDVPLSALSAGAKRKAPNLEAAAAKWPKLTIKPVKNPPKTTAKPKSAASKTAAKTVKTAITKVTAANLSKERIARKQTAQTLLARLSARPIKITVKSSASEAVKKGANKAEGTKGTSRNRKENASILVECSTVVPFKWSLRCGLACFYCGRQFRDVSKLKEHTVMEDYRTARPIINKLLREFTIKVDVTSITCRLCDEPLNDLDDLRGHLSLEHGKLFHEEAGDGLLPFKISNDCFACLVCGDPFNSFRMLYKHMDTHFGKYHCPKCDRKCLSQKKLDIHLSFHKTFKCPLCELTFSTELKVKTHIFRAHGDVVPAPNSYKCPTCPETFKYNYNKHIHLIKVHNVKSLIHRCLACNKVFFRKGHLNQHTRRVHMLERDYECDICKKRFWSKGDMSEHMVSHGAQKMHHCGECKMSFVQRKSLKHHILRKHKEEKKLVCPLCGKAFLLPAELRCHMRTRKHRDMVAP